MALIGTDIPRWKMAKAGEKRGIKDQAFPHFVKKHQSGKVKLSLIERRQFCWITLAE